MQRAVALAGGFTERASKAKITIEREEQLGERIPVDLNSPVQPGDVVTVGESFF